MNTLHDSYMFAYNCLYGLYLLLVLLRNSYRNHSNELIISLIRCNADQKQRTFVNYLPRSVWRTCIVTVYIWHDSGSNYVRNYQRPGQLISDQVRSGYCVTYVTSMTLCHKP